MAKFKDLSRLIDPKTNTIVVPNGSDERFGSGCYGWAVTKVTAGVTMVSTGYTACSGLALTSASTGICVLSHFPPAFQGEKIVTFFSQYIQKHAQTDTKYYLFGNGPGAEPNATIMAALKLADVTTMTVCREPAFSAVDAKIDGTGLNLEYRLTGKVVANNTHPL